MHILKLFFILLDSFLYDFCIIMLFAFYCLFSQIAHMLPKR